LRLKCVIVRYVESARPIKLKAKVVMTAQVERALAFGSLMFMAVFAAITPELVHTLDGSLFVIEQIAAV